MIFIAVNIYSNFQLYIICKVTSKISIIRLISLEIRQFQPLRLYIYNVNLVVTITSVITKNFEPNWYTLLMQLVSWMSFLIKYVSLILRLLGNTKANHKIIIIMITSGILNQLEPKWDSVLIKLVSWTIQLIKYVYLIDRLRGKTKFFNDIHRLGWV